ncbi:hypothetical protein D9M69_175280 [compost metagenome]
MHALPFARRAQARCRRQRVQHDLAVAVADPLRVAGGAGGIEGGRLGVLVEVRELEVCRRLRQQRLVLAGERHAGLRHLLAIGQQHEARVAGELRADLLDHRQEVRVHQHDRGAGIVERVEDLLGRQPHIDGEQRGPHHRHAEIAFQVAVAVPVHHGHGAAMADVQRSQRRGQLADAVAEIAEGVAHLAAVADLLVAVEAQGIGQQLLDQQRIGVGRLGRCDQVVLHVHLLEARVQYGLVPIMPARSILRWQGG